LALILVAAGSLGVFLPAPADATATVSAHGQQTEEGGAAQPPEGTAATPEAAAGATFVGQETCVTCHDDVEAGLAPTAHGSQAFLRLAPHGCETCHGPGSLHVDDPENEATQPRVERMTPEQQSATCRTCHDGRDQFFWESSEHAGRDLSCMSCHSVHHPQSDSGQLRLASDVQQCASCHKDVRAETWKNSHHPIREGEMSCSDCHNPHGSPAESMVRADSINDLCYSCHTEKRGPFLWEHAPVRESCMTCHTPHGSNHAKLQRVANPWLCQQCHANTRHPGTLYDARNLPVAPDGLPVPSSPSNRIVERGCVNCHSAVHGSNHPSSPYLAH
jgi:DmsE family decaheme c-type cytochrome